MFIESYSGNLINTAHIISVGISAPYLEQKNYSVMATLTYGSAVLFDGNEAECKQYMARLAVKLY